MERIQVNLREVYKEKEVNKEYKGCKAHKEKKETKGTLEYKVNKANKEYKGLKGMRGKPQCLKQVQLQPLLLASKLQ